MVWEVILRAREGAKRLNEAPEITLYTMVCEAVRWKTYQFENDQKKWKFGHGFPVALKNLFFWGPLAL